MKDSVRIIAKILTAITLWSFAVLVSAQGDYSLEANFIEKETETFDASKIGPSHIKIILQGGLGKFSEKNISNKNQERWLKSCKQLGDSLLIGNGPWGLGAFSDHSCWIRNKKLVGSDIQKNAWELEFLGRNNTLVIRILNPKKVVESILEIPLSPGSMEFFDDKEFTDLVAIYLLDGLPASGYLYPNKEIQTGVLKGRSIHTYKNGQFKYGNVEPPKELNAYILERHSKFYKATIKGSLIRESAKKLDKDSKSKVELESDKKGIIWTFDPAILDKNSKIGYWFHNSQGRGAYADRLKKSIEDANNKLNLAFEDGALSTFILGKIDFTLLVDYKGGYLGVRYGRQAVSGDHLLSKTSVLGIVTEVKGGYLKGLRIYYDRVPKTEYAESVGKTSIEWDRFILGKSFGFKVNKFVDRIDLTPKIGLWNFDTNLLVESGEEGAAPEISSFKMKRALSLAVEAGVEWYSPKYAVRLWYGLDGAASIGKVGAKSVTSNRFGVDGFWKTGRPFRLFDHPFNNAILAFIYMDTLEITDSSITEPGQISGVTLNNSGYAGLGFAISW